MKILIQQFNEAINESQMSNFEIALTLLTDLKGLERIRSGLHNDEITPKQRQEIEKFIVKNEKRKRHESGNIFFEILL